MRTLILAVLLVLVFGRELRFADGDEMRSHHNHPGTVSTAMFKFRWPDHGVFDPPLPR